MTMTTINIPPRSRRRRGAYGGSGYWDIGGDAPRGSATTGTVCRDCGKTTRGYLRCYACNQAHKAATA